MLADYSITARSGNFRPDIHKPGTYPLELIDFIADELPQWRDDIHQKFETSEPVLTGYLCDYLNEASRTSEGWSHIQFRTEVKDEIQRGRTIDLTAKPCGATIFIEGRRHTLHDMLLPIECKRLPTPKGKDRDHREYVITKSGSTGGIQRFKFGFHGSDHKVAAMIAYVQDKTAEHWLSQVNYWIEGILQEDNADWDKSDKLEMINNDKMVGLCRLLSSHRRQNELEKIELRHLWILMSRT